MNFSNVRIKTGYFIWSTKKYFHGEKCPYCDSKDLTVVDRKYMVTKLLKCKNCQLSFGFPKDTDTFLKKFYQSNYDVNTHIITKIPSDDELARQMDENFQAVRNVVKYIKAVNNNPDLKIVAYGCS